MAVINYTIDQINPHCVAATWPSMHNGDTGLPLTISGFTARALSATGTPGSDGEVSVEGNISLSNPNFFNLNTLSTFPVHDIGLMLNVGTVQIRPNIINGDGTTDLDVTIVFVSPVVVGA